MPPLSAKIGIILLAAGRGKRYGRDKLDETCRGRPLWTWAACAAEEAGFVTRFLVRAAHSSVGNRAGWHEILNSAAAQGMGTSIAAGVEAAQGCSRLVVALADMPLVEPRHLANLAHGSGTVFTRLPGGRHGSPAGFPASVFGALCTLEGDAGARMLGLPDVTAIEPANPGSLCDVDTQEDLAGLLP